MIYFVLGSEKNLNFLKKLNAPKHQNWFRYRRSDAKKAWLRMTNANGPMGILESDFSLAILAGSTNVKLRK